LEGNPRETEIEPGITNKNDRHFEQIPMDLIPIWLCLNMEKQFTALNLMVDHNLGMGQRLKTYYFDRRKTSNSRQYGQMEKQRWEESAKRREKARRAEKRKS